MWRLERRMNQTLQFFRKFQKSCLKSIDAFRDWCIMSMIKKVEPLT
jgi:hypothetical protein